MLSVCALAAVPAPAAVPEWAQAGERLTYTLTYLRLVGGTMVLENGPAREGAPFLIVMRANSSPFVTRFTVIDDRFESLLDPERLTTLASRKWTREGKRSGEESIEFDPEAGTARRRKNGRDRETVAAPAPVFDTLGAVFHLRTLDLAPGKAFQYRVHSGGVTYPLVVVVTGRERLKTPTAPVDCLVVEPRFREGFLAKKEGKLTLWVTTDSTHTPLRIVSELPFGKLTATLTRADRPWSGMVESRSGDQIQDREEHGPQAR